MASVKMKIVLAACLLGASAAPLFSQEAEKPAYELIEATNDWRAVIIPGEEGGARCAIYARPLYSEVFTNGAVSFAERGERVGFITWSPNSVSSRRGAVSFHAGIKLDETPGAHHMLIFDERIGYNLLADGGRLYAQSRDEPAIVEHMRGGREMALQATTEAGNIVKDTYSLLGVQAATRSVIRRCNRR